jgi:hypothetical protein
MDRHLDLSTSKAVSKIQRYVVLQVTYFIYIQVNITWLSHPIKRTTPEEQ